MFLNHIKCLGKKQHVSEGTLELISDLPHVSGYLEKSNSDSFRTFQRSHRDERRGTVPEGWIHCTVGSPKHTKHTK